MREKIITLGEGNRSRIEIKLSSTDEPATARLFFMDFSLLFCLEFFVFRKMESRTTINHPLCGCATDVIQKLPFRLQ